MKINIRCMTVIIFLLISGTAPLFSTEPLGNSFIFKTNGVWHADCSYSEDLVILDEDSGKRTILSLTDLYPGKLFDEHVDTTTAGYEWGLNSLPFIVNLDNRPFFAMHSWTGYRLLVDLEQASIADADKFKKELDSEEIRQITSVITNVAYSMSNTQKCVPAEQLHGAILLAVKRDMHNMRKYLEIIEKHNTFGRISGSHGNYSYTKGLNEEIRKQWYNIHEHRRFAQLALRRMGFAPLGYPQYVFGHNKKCAIINPEQRRLNALKVKSGTISQKVYERLGAPDYIMSAVENDDTKGYAYLKKKWINGWRYDFSAPKDFSIIIIWDNSGRIEHIEKITPALWRGDDLFSLKPVFWADGGLNGISLYSSDFLGQIDVIRN
jgi:hypothetical protein